MRLCLFGWTLVWGAKKERKNRAILLLLSEHLINSICVSPRFSAHSTRRSEFNVISILNVCVSLNANKKRQTSLNESLKLSHLWHDKWNKSYRLYVEQSIISILPTTQCKTNTNGEIRKIEGKVRSVGYVEASVVCRMCERACGWRTNVPSV